MSEYIPKDKVLELWWYWKFIEAYDQTKAMKGIELDDYVPREWHDRVCEEMAKHHMRHKMLDDGTLVVSVDDATKVTRVLVEDEKKNGDLYYADRPRGEWIDEADKYDASFGIHDYRCSNCNSYADEYIGGHEWYTASKPNFCPYCGADMRKGADDE